MGRKRTFPGVRFSWKRACLEFTSHGTKQQCLKNRLKNFFSSRPAKLQDGCVLFCIGCFYMVLRAQQASCLLRGDFKPIPSHIPTHTPVQEEGANRSITPCQPFSLYRCKQAHKGNLKQRGPNTSSREPGFQVPLAWDAEVSTLPASVHLQRS